MSITCLPLTKVAVHGDIKRLHAEILYPKLVFFEDYVNIRIVDVSTKDEPGQKELVVKFEHEILDKTLQDHLLWIILKSGEVFIIDVVNGSQAKIKLDNYSKYQIKRIRNVDNKIYFFSEGGECLHAPLGVQELSEKVSSGTEEIAVTLEKIRLRRFDPDNNIHKQFFDGLYVFIDRGQIVVECPVTGLQETICTNVQLDHIVPWGELAILSSKENMWAVNLKDSNVCYKFENNDSQSFYPLAVHNSGFYYLLWDKLEIQICCALNAAITTEEYTDSTSKSKQSTQEVLKTQLQTLIDAALTSKDAAQILIQIKPYFEKIEHLPFLINNATKLCQHDLTYKSILYLLQKKAYSTSDEESMHHINELMIKVDLLDYIHFSGKSCYENVNILQQNYKELLITFITKSDLDLASICWIKYSEMKLKILPSDVLDILSAIPQNIKMGALLIWFKNFVPCLLEENPYFIDNFVNWTIQRVFSFEKSPYWPKIGLKFIDEIINVLDSSMTTVSIRPISMDHLDSLKGHIYYIMELKEKYNITMTLREISSMSPNEAALAMLRRCYAEDLSTFLQDFLLPYSTRYLFDMDSTLCTVIKTEAASCGGGINSSRLKILLNAFHSNTMKLECFLQILKVLDVPWDETVLELAIKAAASAFNDFTISETDRALAYEIQKELNYAKVKVVLKKYNIPLNCTDYSLVLQKLVNAPTVDLNDLNVITSVLNSYTNYGNVLYIDRCLRDCETRAALEYFNKLPNKQKRILLKTILNKYEQIIKESTSSSLVERNYIDFLKGTNLLNGIQINNVENLYHLKNSFDISMDFNAMYNERICAEETAVWKKGDHITASSGRGHCLNQLTRTHQSRQSELVLLLRRTSTKNDVRKLVESLITSFSDGEESSAEHIRAVLSSFIEDVNSSLLMESFNVLIDLVSSCTEEHLHYLMKYLSVLNALINGNIIVKHLAVAWKFNYIFLPMSSVTATNELIPFYANNLTGNNLDKTILSVKNKNDLIMFRILSAVSNDILPDELITARNNTARSLLSKVAISQDLDELLLTSLLLMLSEAEKPEDYTWILSMLQGQNDSMPPAILRYLSSPLIRNAFALDSFLSSNVVSYSPQYIIKSKFNINLTNIDISDNTEETWDGKVVLFYVLRMYPETSFERLIDLCRNLNISVNDGLSLQLIALLSSWELKYKTYKNDLGCRQVYFENDEKELISKCFAIWASTNEKNLLKNFLNDIWKNGESTLHGRTISINPYYYEVYICIFHLIYGSSVEMRSKKEYFLLNFLKEYRRKSAPKQYEFELFSVKGIFPEIGYYRLPFHLFMREDMWSNLKCEITLETYERWLSAVALLSLDPELQTAKDMICSNAIKQSMTARKRNENVKDSKDIGPWQITAKEEPLLHSAHRCLRNIENMDWRGACLFYVLQGLTRGADQVAAAQLSYQFAQRWAAQQPDNRAARQMERLHFTLSTHHALHKIDWASEEFVRLVAEPAQLIRTMYLHPNLVEKISRHDVNRIADEIADRNGINISSIRFQILENILSKQNEDSKRNDACGLDTKTLMVAKYILKAACPKMSAIYLSRIVIDDESDLNKYKKLRALQCLMSIVDSDTALKVTNKDRDALWPLLLELLYTVNLENIDMPWLVATFAQNKINVLEQLLHTVSGNLEGLKVTADLARRYGNVKHIRELLPLLLRAGLYEEMIPSLLKICTPPDDIIYTAWRTVILSPFQRADYPITERQKAKCLKAINLLPVCPVIKDEDLIEVWKHCVRCKCVGLGCLVLPYISPEKRQSISELQKIDKRKLIASLKNLHSETFLVSGAMLVVESLSSRVYR